MFWKQCWRWRRRRLKVMLQNLNDTFITDGKSATKPCLRDWLPIPTQCPSLEAASPARCETDSPRSSSGSQFLRSDADRRGAGFLAVETNRRMTDSPWSQCSAVSGSRERSRVLRQADNQKVEGSLIYVNNMQHNVTIVHTARYVQVKFVSKLKYLDIYLVAAKCIESA